MNSMFGRSSLQQQLNRVGPKSIEPEVDHEMLAINENNVSESLFERFVGLSEVLPPQLLNGVSSGIDLSIQRVIIEN